MDKAFQLAPLPTYQAEKPVRYGLYQRLIKRFPCLVGGAAREIDPMHTGRQGLGAKACDLACLRGAESVAGNLTPTRAHSPSVTTWTSFSATSGNGNKGALYDRHLYQL